jgi:hypothetical protein
LRVVPTASASCEPLRASSGEAASMVSTRLANSVRLERSNRMILSQVVDYSIHACGRPSGQGQRTQEGGRQGARG